MNLAEISKALSDRADADIGAGGLFNGAGLITNFFYAAIPESAVMPYCVLDFVAGVGQDMFTKNMIERTFQIATFVPRASTSISDTVYRGSQIQARLYGDGTNTSAYGFHRFSPTLTDWTATSVIFLRDNQNHTDDTYCWIQEFRLWCYK